MTPSTYLTVAGVGTSSIEVRRSRFLGHLERVGTEDQARAVVERIRKQHWDARHHCSAYLLGPDAALARASDDGEPSGTAGAPMLEVLRGRGVSDVVAVVTRYFGGVLLGAGGLVRAYSDAVRATLDGVGLLERRRWQRYDVAVGHAGAGRLENELRGRGVQVLGVDYTDQAVLHLAVPDPDAATFADLLAGLTGGAAHGTPRGAHWMDAGTAPGAH